MPDIPTASAELWIYEGCQILDFLTKRCDHKMGHNYLKIIAAPEEFHRVRPIIIKRPVPELAGELATRLCALAGGQLDKVFFSGSGSEGVETVIKVSRAYNTRPEIIYCQWAFHGLGLLNGVEFHAPTRLRLKILFKETYKREKRSCLADPL
jgi:ornithine--oxo-acid transaminase